MKRFYELYNLTWPRFVSLSQSLVWSTWFLRPYSSCWCDSWEQGTLLHQTSIKPHFNEGNLITALVTDAGWSANDANLCLYRPVGHNQSDTKLSDRLRRGTGDFQWFTCCSDINRQACSSLSTAVVILGPERLRPSDSCPAKREVFHFSSCLTSERERESPAATLKGPYLGHLSHMGLVQMTGWHSALILFPFIQRHVGAH